MNNLSPPELWPRIVNGIVVIAALGIAASVFQLLGSSVKDASFGAFTTLVGTALAAFFGIAATREAGRNAVEAISASNDQARKLAGAREIVNAGDPGHPVVKQLQSLLGP